MATAGMLSTLLRVSLSHRQPLQAICLGLPECPALTTAALEPWSQHLQRTCFSTGSDSSQPQPPVNQPVQQQGASDERKEKQQPNLFMRLPKLFRNLLPGQLQFLCTHQNVYGSPQVCLTALLLCPAQVLLVASPAGSQRQQHPVVNNLAVQTQPAARLLVKARQLRSRRRRLCSS
jgi:hypothetical protein